MGSEYSKDSRNDRTFLFPDGLLKNRTESKWRISALEQAIVADELDRCGVE